MLREENERDLDRKFVRIETWDEFLGRWRAIDTEEEAVGLLYAGTKIQPAKRYVHDDMEAIPLRVDFYLRWAIHENETVRMASRQLIIKHWLRATPLEAQFVETHQVLLGFLAKVAEEQCLILKEAFSAEPPLFQPPYPRFVSQYLLGMHKVWHHREHELSDRDHKAFQCLTEPMVKAMCWWGLSYVLSADYRGKETMSAIEGFLERRGYDPGEVLLKISGYGDPISDLSSHSAQDEVKERAAKALLKMRYWFGRGGQEKFDKSLPAIQKRLEKGREAL